MSPRQNYEIVIAGAGIIGVTLALELHRRGLSVALADSATAFSGASTAAAGMLAAHDPHNPPQLRELSDYSLSLYDSFLARLELLSGLPVPYQTTRTVQYLNDGRTMSLDERSVDPRQLAAAALGSAHQLQIPLFENLGSIAISEEADGVSLRSSHGHELFARRLVHTSGAGFAGAPAIHPRKGQMLRVRIPSQLPLAEVHRSASIYIVPRTQGPQAWTALIGATDEDVGFDRSTSTAELDALRARAAELLPALSSETDAPQVEAWAGLRPATADRLPVIGPLDHTRHQWIASGHYRNGILLAPATAVVLSDLLEEKSPAIDLRAFNPSRFA